jgi:hypothetical protein
VNYHDQAKQSDELEASYQSLGELIKLKCHFNLNLISRT